MVQGSSRLATAIHAMALIMVAEGEESGRPVTSDEMAMNIGAHPVHVRRVMGSLREVGLVISQPGPGGGWMLVSHPESVTLGDIYRAVETESPFGMPPSQPEACCRFAPQLPHALEFALERAEAAMIQELSGVTLADLIDSAKGTLGGVDRAPSVSTIRDM